MNYILSNLNMAAEIFYTIYVTLKQLLTDYMYAFFNI